MRSESAIYIAFFAAVVILGALFGGEPDLHDALVHALMR